MKKLIALITSILLLMNISTALAGSHKSKPGKKPDSVAVQEDGAANSGKSKQKQAKDPDDGDQRDSENGDRDKGKAGNNKGNEQSQEMRDRRDERKDIQEEYRANRDPGQEGQKTDGESAKKPWYKFWE